MNSCSQSLPQSGIAAQSYSLVPSGEIDLINSVSTHLPLEIWDKIFNYLGFQNLKLFTEHKVKILKLPLNGNEDNHRLMMGDDFIFDKKDFLNVVKSVYSVALCCKEFYGLTQRERKLLINAARWARIERGFLFSEQTPIRNKQDENKKLKIDKLQEIFHAPSYKDLIPTLNSDLNSRIPLDIFKTNVVNERLIDQSSRPLVNSIKLEPLKSDKLDRLKADLHEFKTLDLDKIFEEIKVTEFLVDKNQTNSEQRRSSDSKDE